MKFLLVLLIGIILFKLLFLYFEQKGLYHPSKTISSTPDNISISFQDVYFKTNDGKSLNGWFVPAANAEVTILYCHGNAGNISDRLHKAGFFHNAGFNFFIFDYRGYGKSSGKPNEGGLYTDAEAAYDYLLSRGDIKRDSIVVYGKSLGGPVAVNLCLKRKARALILEGSFASVTMRAQELYPLLPMGLLVSQRFDAVSNIDKITIPKLIVHGKSDEVIAFRHAQLLYEKAAFPKSFLPFKGGHNDDIYVTSDVYREELNKFLRENKVLL